VDRCRICAQPATASLGAYRFCARHRERAVRQRTSLWRADLLSLGVLALFAIGMVALQGALAPDLSDETLIVIGGLLALVPAAVWLAFFWRRDRLEPEPAGMVLGVLVLGWLVAGALASPILAPLTDLANRLDGAGLGTELLARILVTGVVQMTLIYLIVRLSVYTSPEFDEWTDGILYGTAAGLGLATWGNMAFIVDAGGAELGAAALRITLNALVLGSLGGLVGWFLGHDRLEVRPVWWMPAGILLAAALDGIYWVLRSSFSGGLAGPVTTFGGLVLAIVLAAGVTAFLAISVQRELSQVLRGAGVDAGPEPRPGSGGGVA
jgi:RsiW-degrading membrane proteinase PrsW (M82 family)